MRWRGGPFTLMYVCKYDLCISIAYKFSIHCQSCMKYRDKISVDFIYVYFLGKHKSPPSFTLIIWKRVHQYIFPMCCVNDDSIFMLGRTIPFKSYFVWSPLSLPRLCSEGLWESDIWRSSEWWVHWQAEVSESSRPSQWAALWSCAEDQKWWQHLCDAGRRSQVIVCFRFC